MSTAYAGRRKVPIPRLFAPGSSLSELVLALIIALGIGVGALAAEQATIARMLVGIFGGLCFFLIAMNGRTSALYLSVVFMVFLGLIRRLLIPFAGWSDQDPLLLIGPGCAFMIWLNSRDLVPKHRDALTLLTTFFFIWTVGQIFNPAQGSIAAGAFGAIFWIPPLLWFFVGRTFNATTHRKVAAMVIALAIPAALHGLYQTFFGLFPFEYTWLGVSGFGAAVFFEGFRIRSFGPLVSPQEYGAFLSVAITFLWGTILAGHSRRILRVALLTFLLFALFMQGSRSIFALCLAMMVITSVIWIRNVGAKILIVFGIAAAVVFVSQLPAPEEEGSSAAMATITHQLSGLLNPEDSTAGLHTDMISRGFSDAWENPLGLGTSSATILKLKEGETSTLGTEFDISNVFLSMGIPVGVAYLMFLAALFYSALRRLARSRSAYSIATVGIFIAVFGNIWSGGMYAVTTILWFTIGGLARAADPNLLAEEESEQEPEPPPDVPTEDAHQLADAVT